MTLDPQVVYAVVRDGKIVAVRMKKAIAEACAKIEKDVYDYDTVVVPVMLSEIAENE